MRTLCALLVAVPLSISAATTNVTVSRSDGQTTQIDVADPNAVDIIVEFRDTPMFARPLARSATSAATAMKSFDARFAQFSADVATMAPRITHTFRRVYAGASLTVPRSAIAQIARLSYVRRVHLDRSVHTLAEDGVTTIDADQVWTTYGTRGEGIVVAVIDTGIDYTHPALGGSFGSRGRVIGGWDFVNKDSDPMDDNGHGTHVAGIIGGDGGGITGVAPAVKFLAYKVLNENGSGKDSDVIAGVERAADPNQDGVPSDHADVVNMSLGGPGDETAPLPQAVETATQAGVVFCIAAGNSGGFFNVGAPAVAPSAIAVGATDLKDAMAIFSSGGPAGATLALKPEVVAPGVEIVSAKAGGGTITHSGTSMATPFVAGVAALVKSIHPDWTPADIKSAIVTTAENLPTVDVMAQGGGRVNALRACGADVVASPATVSFGRDDASLDRWSASRTIDLTNRSDRPVTLTAASTVAATGSAISVDPSTLTIQPGGTAAVTLKIDINNPQLPYPDADSLAYAGRIDFTGGSSPIHVPWAFIKSARITATYDRDEFALLLVTGTGGSSTLVQHDLDPDRRSADAHVKPGVYDLEVSAVGFEPDGLLFRYILGGRQTVNVDSTYSFSADSAKPAAISSTDDQGRALADIGRTPGVCFNSSFLALPASSPYSWISFSFSAQDGARMLIAASAPHDDNSVTATQTCWDGESSLYIAQYGVLDSSNAKDGTFPLDPSSWQRIPLTLVVPEAAQNPSLQWLAMTVTRGPSFLAWSSRRIPLSLTDRMWTGTLFITPERHPRVTAGASLLLSDKAETALDSGMIRATSDGILPWPYPTLGPATYVGKPGDMLTFGGGPVHPESFILVFADALRTYPSWFGPLGEYRPLDAKTTNTIVRDSAGVTIPSSALYTYALPARGVYEAELTNGTATLRARIDSRLADAVAPSIRMLRVLDQDGLQTSRIGRTAHAILRFAALDAAISADGRSASYAAVNTQHTTASWRLHGSDPWQPLVLRVEATELVNDREEEMRLGHSPAGVVFAADLFDAAQTVGDIDLHLHIEDDSGNSVEYVLSPALTVTPNARRRAVKP